MLSATNPKRPRTDRHQPVALTMASLIAGLLMVVNCDRVTHAGSTAAPGSSQHGWPWVYLKRELAETPVIFIGGRTYSWPLPPVEGEIREVSYQNLAFDLLLIAAITIAVYFAVKAVVYRYDHWKYGISNS